MPKIGKCCNNCGLKVFKYPSQFMGERFYCSIECKAEGQKRYFVGDSNPNYKHGVHCNESICICGNTKDYRAKQCNGCKANIEKYFKKNTAKRNHILWRYIESYKLLDYSECVTCGQSWEWNGKYLVLQLDHVDGDTSNNELSNLRVLCPNCHSQTDTYASRNKRRNK